ncbi:MAG: UDP-N-acetylglucosamine 2-epimerase (hydrolyzing), partial [Planctomycetota bacterium]
MEHDPVKRSPRAKKRRIAVVTGTRAEYGLLRSVIAAIDAHPRLELQLVACGMHLLEPFGRTIDDIIADGWPIARAIRMQAGDDSFGDQAFGLARGVVGLAKLFEKSPPAIVVVLGDRIEAMAGALAGVTTGRLVAHIHGGDVAPGDFDESLRHAITKLANIHLAATKAAARRIARMGEPPESIHVVGAPGLDRIREILIEQTTQRAAGPTRRR